MEEVITVDRPGGTPRIRGGRITIYNIVHFLEAGTWTVPQIAEVFNLPVGDVEAAVKYIEDHREEVMAVHRQIEERIARGNPPEIRAKLKGARARLEARREELRRAKAQEGDDARAPGGR